MIAIVVAATIYLFSAAVLISLSASFLLEYRPDWGGARMALMALLLGVFWPIPALVLLFTVLGREFKGAKR